MPHFKFSPPSPATSSSTPPKYSSSLPSSSSLSSTSSSSSVDRVNVSAGVSPSKIRGHSPYFIIIIKITTISIITKIIIKTILIILIMCESTISVHLSVDTGPTGKRQKGEIGGKTKKKIILTDFPPFPSRSTLPGRAFDSFVNSAVFAFALTKQCGEPGVGWAEPNVSLRPSPTLDSVWPGFCLPSQLGPQPMRSGEGARPMGGLECQAGSQAAPA